MPLRIVRRHASSASRLPAVRTLLGVPAARYAHVGWRGRISAWRRASLSSCVAGNGSGGSGSLAAAVVVAGVVGLGGAVHAAPSLIAAARAGNDGLVRRLLKQGADPNNTEGQMWGNTPLKEAANYNHVECVELLIAAGADLNKADRAGETPLMVTSLSACPSPLVFLPVLRAAGSLPSSGHIRAHSSQRSSAEGRPAWLRCHCKEAA